MNSNYYTFSRKSIVLGSRIAKGGEGEVYDIENSSYCIKIYHPNLRTGDREEKLKHMCTYLPSVNGHKMFRICWPEELVYCNGEFVGFIMQKAYEHSIIAYHLCQVSMPNKLSSKWQQTYDRQSFSGTINRLKLTTNIVASIHHIHQAGNYVLADLKPQNILLTLDGKVSLIDLDSIQVTGNNNEIFKAPVSTPEYTPPEAKYLIKNNQLISTNWDVFSLGVIIYEVLCGIHPYAGTANPPNDNLTTIYDKIENNLTHINVGKDCFSVLPPPHMNFFKFSTGLQGIFKQIFSERGLYDDSRPKVLTLGEMLAEEVNFRIREKDKLEKQEAINNYSDLKNKYLIIERSNTSLQSEVEEYKIELDSRKNKINSLKTSFGGAVALCVLFFVLFFASIYGARTSTNQQTSNNHVNNEYEQAYNQLSEENKRRQYEIIDLNTQISKLEAKNEQLRTEIESLNSSSSNYSNISQPTKSRSTQYQSNYATNNYMYVTTIEIPGGSLRRRPDSDSEEIIRCPKGATVYVLEYYNDRYYKVSINGYLGYIFKNYLTKYD